MEKNITFYELLQKNTEKLDLRDARGKHHDLAYVLLGVMLALFRERDGNLSGIHRSMENTNRQLYTSLGIEEVKVVSRSQLPEILKRVNLEEFERVFFEFSGQNLSEDEKTWFAMDGKELRGSIEKGSKRGEVLVQAVSHSEQSSVGHSFYNGKKESEIPCARDLLRSSGLESQKVSLDALHLVPQTVSQIEQAGGFYLIGLKDNQKELLAEMEAKSKISKPQSECVEDDKGHGRVEKREYETYDICKEYFDERWRKANFQTLVKVNREIFKCKEGNGYSETSYYMSNQKVTDSEDVELSKAVRAHWSVETNNHKRDVTLKEDALKTKKTDVTKLFANCRTLVMNLLTKSKPKNLRAKLQLFADRFELLFDWLKKIKFL